MKKPLAVAFLTLAFAAAARADDNWNEPKDGVVTVKEADLLLKTLEKCASIVAAFAKETKGKPADAMRLKKCTDDIEAARADSGMSRAEYEWVNKTFGDAATLLMNQRLFQKKFDESVKAAKDELAAAEKALAEVQAQRKAGRRILSDEDKAAAKQQAEEELKNAEATLTDAKARVKEAREALAAAEAELKKADAESKEGAQQTVDGAKESLKAQETSEQEASRAAERARRKAKDPAAPADADEKAAIDQEFASREETAKSEVDAKKQKLDLMEGQSKELKKSFDEAAAKLPPQNLKLARERIERYEACCNTLLTMGAK